MPERDRPNIVFIMTDQQSRHMMGCSGNAFVKTPAMDSLAADGTRFTRAYCSNPVCVPSRFSLFTGRMPSEIELHANGPAGVAEIPEQIKASGLGWTLKAGGYDAVFAGKQHFPKMIADDLGFDVLTLDERDEMARMTAEYVSQKHERPYCLVASFINPHDICYMAIRDNAEGRDKGILDNGKIEIKELDAALALAEGIPEDEFFEKHCPPLPPNFQPQDGEPTAVGGLLDQRTFRRNARSNWDEKKWRMHRWAYAKLTERVDGQIGILLDALRSSPDWDNTVVIFTSDHGDHDSSHQLEHKTVPYEEAAGIPFIIREPGGRTGAVDEENVVSNGLDLYPTICDYAGIDAPPHLRGISLRPMVSASGDGSGREAIPIECEIGRAVVTERYKYLKCFDGGNAEQLYDLQQDPHETRNVAGDSDQGDALERHRRLFADLFPAD